MLTDILFTVVILAFTIPGLKHPYIALSGVIWIDTIKPQVLSFGFLAAQPLSMLMTVILLLSLTINIKKIKVPKIKLPLVILCLLMLWITITTYKAQYHYLAVFKYDVAIKTMFFTALMPFVLDTRRKIECVLWVFIVSASFFVIIAGAKTLVGGGGYSMTVIQNRADNSGLGETSTLSAITVVLIPIICYLYRYSLASKSDRFLRLYLLALPLISIFAVIGTYARTGLVASLALVSMMLYTSKNRIRLLVIIVVGCLALIPVLPIDWINRMSSITEASEESSALGRLVVWRWTVDYAKQHPFFGGGFFAYHDNRHKLHLYAKAGEDFETNDQSMAFHSIIFELLGEHGYMGLLIYMSLIGFSLKSLTHFLKTEDEDCDWLIYLVKMIFIATGVYLVGGLFVSIAFEPWLFYIIFIGISLNNLQTNHFLSEA